MNDREVLQALIDGKVIVDESPWFNLYYRLVGDRIQVKCDEHEWALCYYIPKLYPCHVKIVEDE